jgi:hypothetical protein
MSVRPATVWHQIRLWCHTRLYFCQLSPSTLTVKWFPVLHVTTQTITASILCCFINFHISIEFGTPCNSVPQAATLFTRTDRLPRELVCKVANFRIYRNVRQHGHITGQALTVLMLVTQIRNDKSGNTSKGLETAILSCVNTGRREP